jgi:glucose-6-phosphate isomerase
MVLITIVNDLEGTHKKELSINTDLIKSVELSDNGNERFFIVIHYKDNMCMDHIAFKDENQAKEERRKLIAPRLDDRTKPLCPHCQGDSKNWIEGTCPVCLCG